MWKTKPVALTHPRTITATGALDGSTVPEADDLPAAFEEFSPMRPAQARYASDREVIIDGDGTIARN